MFSLSYQYTMLLPFNITGDNAPVQSWVFFRLRDIDVFVLCK